MGSGNRPMPSEAVPRTRAEAPQPLPEVSLSLGQNPQELPGPATQQVPSAVPVSPSPASPADGAAAAGPHLALVWSAEPPLGG